MKITSIQKLQEEHHRNFVGHVASIVLKFIFRVWGYMTFKRDKKVRIA